MPVQSGMGRGMPVHLRELVRAKAISHKNTKTQKDLPPTSFGVASFLFWSFRGLTGVVHKVS
jgi:hypothetical protein